MELLDLRKRQAWLQELKLVEEGGELAGLGELNLVGEKKLLAR